MMKIHKLKSHPVQSLRVSSQPFVCTKSEPFLLDPRAFRPQTFHEPFVQLASKVSRVRREFKLRRDEDAQMEGKGGGMMDVLRWRRVHVFVQEADVKTGPQSRCVGCYTVEEMTDG